MIFTELFESKDVCPICGQTPCNCTSIKESIHDEDCDLCNGTGEGLYDGESCPKCHGTGILPHQHSDDDFDPPDDYNDNDYGDEESYYEKSLRNRGLGEGARDIGSQIKAAYQKIYDAGDDAVEFAYNDSPIFAQYWDEFEGDLDSIIAEVEPSELQIILDELEAAAEDQGVAEGAEQEPTIHDYHRARDALSRIPKGTDEHTQAVIDIQKLLKAVIAAEKKQQQGVAEGGQQWPDTSNSLAKRSAVATNLKGAPSKAGRSSGMTVATRVDPTITPTTVKKLGGERPVPSFLQKNVDEAGQQKGADYRDPPEADYGDDYQDMVARVKKLAGLGPLKTVYDPQKRVYKNVPVAVQPKK